MEPEGPLPCSQEPSTGSYHKPDESSPYHSPRAYYAHASASLILI
jgi:hypothetical protein